MKTLTYVGGFVGMLAFLAILGYGGWHLKRWFNYSFGYGSQVESTICDLVKPEALKIPCD